MGSSAPSPWTLRAGRPSLPAGVLTAIGGAAIATGLVYPLAKLAPVVSLSVVYLPGVVLVSVFWGLGLGLAAAGVSAAAFNFFHLPPVGTFDLVNRRDWASLGAFAIVAVATGLVADVARTRADDADRRRREADLIADLAQLLLGGPRLEESLPLAAQRLAATIGVDSAALDLRELTPNERQLAFPLAPPDGAKGTLLLPSALSLEERERIAQRIIPALESILSAAQHRARLQAELVETTVLRRSDEMKTAVLRSVSHDLRTPVTAILTAASALEPDRSSPEDVAEVRDVVTEAGTRLARLIEKLLDLTMLQAGTLEARRDWYSLEEVISEAISGLAAPPDAFRLDVDPEIPLLHGDAGQLERVFGNLLENALRYSGDKPVLVRGRVAGRRVRIRVVDQGPGISLPEQERIFLPFYRSPETEAGTRTGSWDDGSARRRAAPHDGSGLGLAIAQGFVNVAGGTIAVESLPGQGATFVIELPLMPSEAAVPSTS